MKGQAWEAMAVDMVATTHVEHAYYGGAQPALACQRASYQGARHWGAW